MKKLFLLLVLLCLSSKGLHAQDDEWMDYAKASDGTLFFVHKTKIRDYGNKTFDVWVKAKPKSEKPVFKNKATPKYSYNLTQFNIDCGAQTLKVKSQIFYAANGNLVDSNNSYSVDEAIIPGSVGETLADIFCKNPPFPAQK